MLGFLPMPSSAKVNCVLWQLVTEVGPKLGTINGYGWRFCLLCSFLCLPSHGRVTFVVGFVTISRAYDT